MRVNNFFKLIIAISVSLSAGAIGSIFTAPAIPTWYAGLAKPALNPPAWVFGPAWTILYALMGISLFLVWSFDRAQDKKQHSNILPPSHKATEGHSENVRMSRVRKIGIAAFFVQLSLNAIWSIIFFGLQSPGWALVDIVLLWLAIVWTIVVFYKISRLAAYLLIPYLLWVSFASYLNYSIWILN